MRKVLLASLFVAGVAGCGGGGGASVGNPPFGSTPVAFTSFPAIQPNQFVTFSNVLSVLGHGVGTTSVTSLALDPIDASGTASIAFDANTTPTQFSHVTSTGSVFAASGFGCGTDFCSFTTTSADVIYRNYTSLGWNYQTFGFWDKDIAVNQFDIGAFSIGNPTPASAVPTTGNFTFNGFAAGIFIDTAGTTFTTTASMAANVDFTARSIGFATSGTQVTDAGGNQAASSGLNLSGTLTYAPGTNGFSGPVTTGAIPGLTGTAQGRFYGPAAQEIGGVYSLSGASPSVMIGGFGGKR